MKVLLTGAGGQLGHDISTELQTEGSLSLWSSRRTDLDVFDLGQVIAKVVEIQPDAIVNAAAYTDVDACETEVDQAFRVNALGARNVAIAARQVGAKLVHISTDYVFDGQQAEPYREDGAPRPRTIYGRSKWLGEQLVKEQTHDFFIVRTAWLYGAHGQNFVKTMLRLAKEHQELRVVNDQHGSPTCTSDLAQQIVDLLSTERYGTYHASSQGACTWYEFACEIFRQADVDVSVVPVSTEEFPRPAPRPQNSVLDNYFLRLQNMDSMPHWKDALVRFLDRHSSEELTTT